MSQRTQDTSNKLQTRRVPCLVAFLHPFRLVDGPTSPEWNVSLDQVNTATWDYVALHQIVGGIDVGLEPPYHMVVCRDGALALPPTTALRRGQAAIELFNQCLAAILLGGVYCEAISSDGLDFGSILDWQYVRVTSYAPGAANRFHFSLRGQYASPLDAIALNDARRITISELVEAAQKGRYVLEKLPSIGGEFLLKGVTGYARRDWGTALANLWIVVEQLTTHLWTDRIIAKARKSSLVSGRLDMLRDNRTWTIAARHEMLFQLGELSKDLFGSLFEARKARNVLSHDGIHPDEGQATALLSSVKNLFGISLPDFEMPFLEMDLKENAVSNPFEPVDGLQENPRYWMEIKKLPGEAELEKLEAEGRERNMHPATKTEPRGSER